MFGKQLEPQKIQEFPNIPDDYFDIKDDKTIAELNDLYNKTKNTDFILQGNDEFKMKQQNMINLLKPLEVKVTDRPDIYNIDLKAPFQNFDYYDLSEITYNQVEAKQAAEQMVMENNFQQLNLKQRKPPKQNLTKKLELLSFQDEY